MAASWQWAAFAVIGMASSAVMVTGVLSAPCGLCDGVRQAARIVAHPPGEGRRLRHEALVRLFADHAGELAGEAAGEGAVSRFSFLVKREGLVTFGQFLESPVKGGPGGIVEGRPLEEQPAYREALRLLAEHTDFYLAGTADPDLTLGRVPEPARAKAFEVYGRLNPADRYRGGFDHPLFLAVLRESGVLP